MLQLLSRASDYDKNISNRDARHLCVCTTAVNIRYSITLRQISVVLNHRSRIVIHLYNRDRIYSPLYHRGRISIRLYHRGRVSIPLPSGEEPLSHCPAEAKCADTSSRDTAVPFVNEDVTADMAPQSPWSESTRRN